MTDRSTEGVCNVPGGEEQPRGAQESPAPPHLPQTHTGSGSEELEGESQHAHPIPHPGPHELQLQQGDLRDRLDEDIG